MNLNLGPYTAGEIPDPVQYQFKTWGRQPINLTDYDVVFNFGPRHGTPAVKPAVLVDATHGIVEHVWDVSELATPGVYVGQFWVENGVNRYASETIIMLVRPAVGVAPTLG